jgi:hypothetical protein
MNRTFGSKNRSLALTILSTVPMNLFASAK